MLNKVTLVIVAHMDDEALNCGGLIRKRVQQGYDVHVLVMFGRKYFSGNVAMKVDRQEEHFITSKKILGYKDYILVNLEEGEPLKSVGYYTVLDSIEGALKTLRPSEVIIPSEVDTNQDHRFLNDACRIALRPSNRDTIQRILIAEGYDTELVQPNYYVPLSKTEFSSKVSAVSCYADEWRESPHPRSEQGLVSKHQLHGTFCFATYAEAYRIYYQKD